MSTVAADFMAAKFFSDVVASRFGVGLAAQPRADAAHLYVIQCPTGEVKIGRAANPHSRLKSLQAGNPSELRLALIVENAGECEFEVHRQLAVWRIRGEWFRPEALSWVRSHFGSVA